MGRCTVTYLGCVIVCIFIGAGCAVFPGGAVHIHNVEYFAVLLHVSVGNVMKQGYEFLCVVFFLSTVHVARMGSPVSKEASSPNTINITLAKNDRGKVLKKKTTI